MAQGRYMVRAYYDVCWIPAGTGPALLLPGSESNSPGYGQAGLPGPAPVAQTRRYQAAEVVVAATPTAPTLAEIDTALKSLADDIAGATGTPAITAAELAIIQGWSSGNP